jgi:hypothetical protein
MNPFYRSVANTWLSPVKGALEEYRVDEKGNPDLGDIYMGR